MTVWDPNDAAPGKACEGDEYPYHDCWQLVDFMRKLGPPLPLGSDDAGERYRFDVETDV